MQNYRSVKHRLFGAVVWGLSLLFVAGGGAPQDVTLGVEQAVAEPKSVENRSGKPSTHAETAALLSPPRPRERTVGRLVAASYADFALTPDPAVDGTEYGELRVVPYQRPIPVPSPPADTSLSLVVQADTAKVQVPQNSRVVRVPKEEALALLAQVPTLEVPFREEELYLPPERLRPPLAGDMEIQSFPPPETSDLEPSMTQDARSLQVLRFTPSQNVDVAPYVSVTFSKPMVPLTSHATLAVQDIPVTLSPQPAGEWYWLGTQTLIFQPAGRLAGATRYRAEIPAGIKSVDGSILEAAVGWEFETSRLSLTQFWPPDDIPQRLRPYVALEFNQAIDPRMLLPFVTLHSSKDDFAYAVLQPEDHTLPYDLQAFLSDTVPERTLLLQPLEDLPSDTNFTVTVGRGAPSSEGPLPTLDPQRRSLHTYPPLRVHAARYAFYSYGPGQTLDIHFNHRLNPDSLTSGMASIKPPLPEGTVRATPWGIYVDGPTAPNTTYAVRLEPGLTDEFGQSLDTVLELHLPVGEHAEPEPEPDLHFPSPMEVLYPHNEGRYAFFTRNLDRLRVVLYPVDPASWSEFRGLTDYVGHSVTRKVIVFDQEQDLPASLQSREPVLDTYLSLEPGSEQTVRTVLDLNPYLDEGRGHLFMVLELPQPIREHYFPGVLYRKNGVEGIRRRDRIGTWIQATDLGLDTYADQDSLVVHAASLTSGESLPDVELQLLPGDVRAVTDAQGHAYIDLADRFQSDYAAGHWIVARQGDDSSLLLICGKGGHDDYCFRWCFGSYSCPWRLQEREPEYYRWHVFTDRYLYRPGEEVHLKGWVRQVGFFPTGDVTWAQLYQAEMHYRIKDARGVELDQGKVRLDTHGALDFSFVVPENANVGYATVQITAHVSEDTYESHTVYFHIEEFRRPEFEVYVEAGPEPHFVNERVTLNVQAQYFGGGPLPGASVAWRVWGYPATYTPPGWRHYAFGVPAWRFRGEDRVSIAAQEELDARGQHQWAIAAAGTLPSIPYSLRAKATVTDLSQQNITASDAVLVHPTNLYVGAKTDSDLATVDEPYALHLIVTDLEGVPVPDQELHVQTRLPGRKAADTESQDAAAEFDPECRHQSTETPVTCMLVFPEPGFWELDITLVDAQGRTNLTRLQRRVREVRDKPVAGNAAASLAESIGDYQIWQHVALTRDREEYQPGDIAQIRIRPSFYPAYGTVITNRAGIVTHAPITIRAGSYTLSVPIEDSHVPNLHVSVRLTGGTPHAALGGALVPVMARGDISLEVPPYSRELALDLRLHDRDLLPGGEAAATVRVTDSEGRPVAGAEVVLLAVNEAILALTGYEFDHPLDTFYPHRPLTLRGDHLREHMQSEAHIPVLPEWGRGGGGEDPTFHIREDFDPLAVFIPSGVTDEQGVFQAAWDLPDTVGRYRVVALATAGPRLFGLSESTYTARLPLQIRTQWPRFLNYGDTAVMSVLVENQSAVDQDLSLVVQSDGLDLAYAAADRSFDVLAFTLPAHSRQQVLVPVQAQTTGEQHLLVTVFNDQVNDTIRSSLPVYVPVSQEGFAAYGIVEDQTTVQGLQLPADIHRNFGQLTISTSSTLLQSLLDGYRELGTPVGWNYPERLASRILANVALHDVLYAFNLPDLPARDVLEHRLQADIENLLQFQQSDGGFPLWNAHDASWPFVSVHSLYALAVAREAGYQVPEAAVRRGLEYLSTIEQHFPYFYTLAARRYITAFALYVRAQLGDRDSSAVLHLLNSVPRADHPLEVLAWSLLVLHQDPTMQDEVATWMEFVLGRVEETTGKASFTRAVLEQDGALVLQSARRSDALLLRALMTVRPQSDLIPKVVQGLLAARSRHGHWGSSQDNVFVLLAINQYFREFEAVIPDFRARFWLDDTLVVNAPFQGREALQRQVSLPMAWLFQEDPERILIQRTGQGKLYYRLGFDYVPTDLQLESRERGFTVLRTYAGVDDPEDVWQDEKDVWHVKLGARVRIDITLVAPGTRHHVLLASPLPAGLEFVNPALKGHRSFSDSGVYSAGGYHGGYYWSWFDHQQLLDERVEAVTTRLSGGIYHYAVIAQATTAGTFQVPPPRAHEIYAPETFGHGPSEVLIVEVD